MADKYGTRDTIGKGIFADVFNSVKGIAPENIDFNEHSRKLLNEVDQLRIRKPYSLGHFQTMDEEDKAKAKIIVWKLLVLIAVKFEYPLGGTQLIKAKRLLKKLCRDPSQGGLKEMFHNYVSEYLAKTTECT
ncbi:MAG: hypothetical protein IJU44_10320 [Kiritimatiellae bacterium]|nr:hypothetical protein [Kiritimatiellia bacterium]